MMKPERPDNEASRLNALQELNILDTPPEEAFDRLTRLAQSVFDVPIALVSLVDRERQWFKSAQGLDASETPRDISFCGHTILSKDMLHVPNALEDERFADNPLVLGPPHIRFYAGAPVSSAEGYRLGTLCIISDQPKQLSSDQLKQFRDLADCINAELARYKAVKALHDMDESESYLRAVLETVDDGIITIDSKGIINTVNHAAEKIFDYPAAEMKGQAVSMLMPESYAANHHRYIENYLLSGDANIIGSGREVVGRRSDGSTFPMDLAVAEMPGQRDRCFVGVVRDITVRKKAETMKQEFISTVSHELRTPLTSIRGALSLVLGRMSEELSVKAKKLLETASRNSEILAHLIDDILDLEKVETGKLNLHAGVTNLVELVKGAVTDNQSYAYKHGVEVVISSMLGMAMVHVDDHRIRQVMANLLSNAIKFSDAGERVIVDIAELDDVFRVSVTDSGRGIPDAFRGKVFQRFSQADSSDSREKGGTGLGLSICKAIIEQHDGVIDFISVNGEGSCFYFELPRWSSRVSEQQHRVLICEDNKDVAMVIDAQLRDLGVEADWSGTLAAAQSQLEAGHYDALLLDLNLPDGHGIDFISRLRATADFVALPVIVISADAESAEAEHGQSSSVCAWLDKPLKRAELKQALESVFTQAPGGRVLHVEDDPDIIEMVSELIESHGLDYSCVETLRSAQQRVCAEGYDLILLDLNLPDGNGLDLMKWISPSETPVVVFSASEPELLDRNVPCLVKSKTSNETLLLTIHEQLRQEKRYYG